MASTFITARWLACEAMHLAMNELPGFNRPVHLDWGLNNVRVQRRGFIGEPLILTVSALEIKPGDDIERAQMVMWRVVVKALRDEIYPYMWAKAMMGPGHYAHGR